MKSNNGEKTLLWTDVWLEEKPLCLNYSTIFELSVNKKITVKEFMDRGGDISFRRWLPNILRAQWEEVKRKVMNQHLTNTPDTIFWGWTGQGKFTVKSTYDHLTANESGEPNTKIWKAKIPYKIKIFLWLLEKGATLTKDNMLKRK